MALDITANSSSIVLVIICMMRLINILQISEFSLELQENLGIMWGAQKVSMSE